MKQQRKKFWIDRFQTYLSLRIAFYFVAYQVAVWTAVAVERASLPVLRDSLGDWVTVPISLFLTTSMVCLGLVFIYDSMILAHRIVGPIHRFRKTIEAITAGEELDLVNLRQDDFLHDLKDQVNEMLKVLEQRGAVVLKKPEAKSRPHPSLSV